MVAPAPRARRLRHNGAMRLWVCVGIAVFVAVVTAGGRAAVGPVQRLDTPGGPDSGMYSLTRGADGRVYLSWIDPIAGGGHALRYARLEGADWSQPVDVARGTDWFVNWADHPSVTAAANGTLFAHLLVNTGKAKTDYGYAIRVAASADRGMTWRTVFEEGDRNVQDYSGFVTFLPGREAMQAVYLTPLAPDDGSGAHHDHIKTVGVVTFDGSGFVLRRQIVDGDACSCCSTDMAMTAAGPVAVYRDHDAGDIRDISIVRQVDGKWTVPSPVHRDGWRIGGCPTNGPAVAADGARVGVAWFTAAHDRPQVLVAFSTDAGATFAAPVRIDGGQPVGWTDAVMLDDGHVLASWLERTSDGVGEVRVRLVSPAGAGESIAVATASSGRGTGIPMMVRDGDAAIVVWRDGGIRSARVTFADSSRR